MGQCVHFVHRQQETSVLRFCFTMIDVRIHSSRHIETKLVLPLATKRNYKYDLHYYIFSPAQLNIRNEETNKIDMLNKFVTHGRYASPQFTIEELVDLQNINSPLTILWNMSTQFFKNCTEIRVIHEIQGLCNTIRHQSRQTVARCNLAIKQGACGQVLKVLAEGWSEQSNLVIERYRSIQKVAQDIFSPESLIVQAFAWGDEALSIFAEKDSLDLYLRLEPYYHEISDSMAGLLDISRSEASYRVQQGFLSANVSSTNNKTEQFTYRNAVLKKWTQSVLYLDPVQTKSPKYIAGILSGIAAGIAMTFATLASIFAETRFTKNGFGWAMIVIIAYIFKDRIKNGLWSIINIFLPRVLADKISIFKSPRSGRVLCRNRTRLFFTDAKKVPKDIAEARKDDTNPFRDLMPTEDVVHYARFMNIKRFKAKDEKQTPWVKNLTLITRIRIDDYLKDMDDTHTFFQALESSDEPVIGDKSNRTYHLHLVIKEECLTNPDLCNLHHFLVVLNKDGIVRLKKLSDCDNDENDEASIQGM